MHFRPDRFSTIFKQNGEGHEYPPFSEIKNMDHKLSNDVSNVFIRHVVQILSRFEIFSKHVILTRKRGGVLKKKRHKLPKSGFGLKSCT